MNYTDDQLKQLLALMLPETVHLSHSGELCWSHNYSQDSHLFVRVLDTELLSLCALAEKTLGNALNPTAAHWWSYLTELESVCGQLPVVFATWQQRCRALAEVKGVTL